MPCIDDATARALAETRYMPLSYYLEIGKPEATDDKVVALEQVLPDHSLRAIPEDQWEKLEWLLTSTAIPQKKAA